MSEPTIRTRRWSRAEYGRLVEAGILQEDDAVELVDGELLVREPKGSRHETAVGLVADVLRRAFGPGWLVRVGAPLALDDVSEPEPDVTVVRGGLRDYRDAHPSRAALVVEVAETGLVVDRTRKAEVYARNEIQDYWIVNLPDQVLEVRRDPQRGAYASIRLFGSGATVAPLAAPSARVRVTDLLP